MSKPREFWLTVSPLNPDQIAWASQTNPGKYAHQYIHVREVLPNDLTPDEVIEKVCEFLRSKVANKLDPLKRPDPHLVRLAEEIQSNKSRILGIGVKE